jgi:hypothetical protein
MPKFDTSVKLALITAILFVVVGYANTYSITQGVFGSVVGGGNYANGNTIENRGFLLHAVVFGLLVWLTSKYYLKL